MRVTLVVALALLAGCAAPPPSDAPAEWQERACGHPWPCGDGSEWPLDLATPVDGFPITEEITPVRIPMDDGIELDGAVWMPAIPEGVHAPVVVWATPYAAQCRYSQFQPDPDDPDDVPSCDEDPAYANNFAADVFSFLTKEGYAAAMVSMRGTGLSGGCFDLYGPRGQQDMAAMAQWFGDQTWSNGRVAMWGVSAMGTTPFMAAIGAPPALKAIAPSGIISDLYLNRFTPQGAPDATSGEFHAGWAAFNSIVPAGGVVTRRYVQDVPAAVPTMAETSSTRWCDDLPQTLAEGASSQLTDERDAQFWEDRRLVSRFEDIMAAVLVMQGFQDFGHAYQEDNIWDTLPNAPKRMLLGQWGHEAFFDEGLDGYAGGASTERILIEWFDFWLKGRGDPPRLGLVDHRAAGGSWRQSAAWPPPESLGEALFFADGALRAAGGAPATFRASEAVHPPACGYGADPPSEGALTFASEPLANATLAGNPFAYLEVTSDQPGGLIALSVYDTDAEGTCVALVAEGAVDLRFHKGNARGEDFPVGVPTPVRVDLFGTAHAFVPGHKILLVLSGTGEMGAVSQPRYAPEITLSPASHLVLPVIEGTLGGAAPLSEYPARPR